MMPTVETLYDVCARTWPAASETRVGPWTIRDGQGGGQRVAAATADGAFKLDDLQSGEAAMTDLNQPNLFMIRDGQTDLDSMLETNGYTIKDPVTYYVAPTETLATQRPPAVTCFQVWPPLATQAEIWDAGGIDDARLAVMHRANGPKTTVLGRVHDTPAGTAFAAIHNGTAMLHAIETSHAFRRQGLGGHMIRALAFWAQDHGAAQIALLVTRANTGANALYSSMGFSAVGGYHYRIHPEATA